MRFEICNTRKSGEINSGFEDCKGDYYLPEDNNRDFEYHKKRLAEALRILSAGKKGNQIVSGERISQGSSPNTVNIPETYAIGLDENGNETFFFIPAMSEVPVPAGWNDSRPIWVKAVHRFSYSDKTRLHRASPVSYHHVLKDGYVGDDNSDDMFTDVEPGNGEVVIDSFSLDGSGNFSLLSGRSDILSIYRANQLYNHDFKAILYYDPNDQAWKGGVEGSVRSLLYASGNQTYDGNLTITGILSVEGEITVESVPDLSADKITSGVFSVSRIPDISASKIVGGTLSVSNDIRLNENSIRFVEGVTSYIGMNSNELRLRAPKGKSIVLAVEDSGYDEAIKISPADAIYGDCSISLYGVFQVHSVYDLTTSNSPNVNVSGADHVLRRSTSSLKYKTDLERIEPVYYKKLKQIADLAIFYRSKCEADNKDWSWYGYGAEPLAEIDPRFVHWGYNEEDYDIIAGDKKNDEPAKKMLKTDAKLVPTGVMYDRLSCWTIPFISDLDDQVIELKEQIAELIKKLDKLEKK